MADVGGPPGDPESGKRRHPRFELCASVELKRTREILVLSVRNISLGGAFLVADGHDLSQFPLRSAHEVVLFDPENVDHQIELGARVARHDADGMAITWIQEEGVIFRLSDLIDKLQPIH